MMKTTKLVLGMMLTGMTLSLQAHTLTVVPSHYVQSKTGSFISVDVSASNMTFQADKGIDLKAFHVVNPDNTAGHVVSSYQGKRKSQADVELKQEGTYRLELGGMPRFFTSYELDGKRERLMGNKQEAAAKLPKGATKVVTTQGRNRAMAFVTVKKPSDQVLALTGKGLEFSFDKHPADIVASEPVTVTMMFDGKPVAGVELHLSFDGELYRNEPGRIEHKTDASGQFTFTPATPGRYLLEGSYMTDIASAQADKLREGFTLSFEAALP